MEKNLGFKAFYASQDIIEKKRIRDKFLQETGLSHPAFYTKLRRQNFSLLERKLLETVCGKKFNW